MSQPTLLAQITALAAGSEPPEVPVQVGPAVVVREFDNGQRLVPRCAFYELGGRI